ncbi:MULTISPECIES: cytidylyltransferase domain-containing protein [unclassified Streptosporangium]|uniref:cytidylyltransferase domain-containing protein n=1 Tax=unclassified Streptosporangium TaxID=2632669 RepID=UPI003FA3B4E4
MPSSGGTTPHHVAVIPCRYGSTRFPGKPLALLGDKPLMWHVYRRCQQAENIAETFIATDDARIQEECCRLGMACLLTGNHLTGTDRGSGESAGVSPSRNPRATVAVRTALGPGRSPNPAGQNTRARTALAMPGSSAKTPSRPSR